MNSDAWKLIVKHLEYQLWEIKELLFNSKTDQKIQFNADHLLKERISIITMFINLPNIMIEELNLLSKQEEDGNKSLYSRLQELDSSMSKTILSKIKT